MKAEKGWDSLTEHNRKGFMAGMVVGFLFPWWWPWGFLENMLLSLVLSLIVWAGTYHYLEHRSRGELRRDLPSTGDESSSPKPGL